MDTVILNPVIPYVGPIAGDSFSPEKLVKLEGIIPPYAYGFNIKLQCGPRVFPSDIALQISVQFLEGYISLNSLQQRKWGKEMRLLNVPIEANQKFKITVMCEGNQYKVIINDEHYCIFPQRIHCEKVSHLSIDGDVSIIRISYESNTKSNTTTPLDQSTNQFNNVQHSDLPPSYDTAMNCSDDEELQISSPKAISNRGCKIFFVFFCVIAAYTLCGFIMYFIIRHEGKHTGYRRYSYNIPSIDTKAIDLEMDKQNKQVNDAMAEMKKMDKQRQEANDMFAKARQMDEDSRSYFNTVQAYYKERKEREEREKKIKKQNMDEANKMISDLLRRRSNLKANKLILSTNSKPLG